ncbi:hypothetical protein ACSLBF_12700 [Pseudoalteromonas sp. T1lg65]|uniref:hypothetical protein n=1 Tax=Pseudoalteromonas sp. T1lg65 TaxID=2077101 RepID=UPI003F79A55D
MDNSIANILEFLQQIELPFKTVQVLEPTFLPGVKLGKSHLLIDLNLLKYPGDILHEAGHYAVMDPKFRGKVYGDVYREGLKQGRSKQIMQGEEMAAIAWSVAAIREIGLPLDVIFHEHGYRGASQSYIEAFSNGEGFGSPLLRVWQMSCEKRGFPHMARWIRTESWPYEQPAE